MRKMEKIKQSEPIEAVFENGVLIPKKKLNLPEHSKVEIIIQKSEQPSLARRLGGSIEIDPEIARHIVEQENLIGAD